MTAQATAVWVRAREATETAGGGPEEGAMAAEAGAVRGRSLP